MLETLPIVSFGSFDWIGYCAIMFCVRTYHYTANVCLKVFCGMFSPKNILLEKAAN